MFAVARYQIEEPSFHPYTSKFDYWLEGKARLSESELRGLLVQRSRQGQLRRLPSVQADPDGLPPLFTDHQYEALGAPRNAALADNQRSRLFRPRRLRPASHRHAEQTQYCGMFKTPTLRNTATRHVFFHNGVFHTLQEVMDFYNFRDTNPEKVYPRAADGSVQKYDDLPASITPMSTSSIRPSTVTPARRRR